MSSRKNPPIRNDRIISLPYLAPANIREMWGMTSPTQPMIPQMLTETTVISVADRITTTVTSRTFTPSAAASSSPAESTSIWFLNRNRTARQIIVTGSIDQTSCMSPLPRLPMSQKVMDGSWLSVSA